MGINRFHRLASSLLLLSLAQLMCAFPPAPQGAPTPTPGAAQPPAPVANLPIIDAEGVTAELNTLIPPVMQADHVSACSVAIAYADPSSGALKSSLINFGTLSSGSSSPVTSTTEYEIGSLSKLFAADLLARLVLDGKMQLDDPLQKYLPADVHVPQYNGQAITLRQLATHTSGLPRNLEGLPAVHKVNGVSVSGYLTEQDIYNFLNTYQLTRAPGEKWEYSNLANAILGLAEERVTGESFEALVLERIAGPLGLTDTRAALSAEEKANLAIGAPQNGKPSPPIAESGEMLAAGGLRSTIQDQAIYLLANMEPAGTELNAALSMTLEQQDLGTGPGMGLGWKIASPGKPEEQYNKSGSTAGYNAYIAFSRLTRTGFVLMCNGRLVENLAPQISKLMGGADTSVDGTE